MKDFGAVGDGVTDDTMAIQAAIDFSSANKKNLIFNAGVFLISDTIILKSHTSMYGNGSVRIVMKGGVDKRMFVNEMSLHKFDIDMKDDDIVIDGIDIDGNGKNQIWVTDGPTGGSSDTDLVYILSCSNLVIRNSRFVNSPSSCLRIINAPGAVISHCEMSDARFQALVISCCDNLELSFCKIHDCGSKNGMSGFSNAGHAIISTKYTPAGAKASSNFVRVIGNNVYDMGDSCLRNETGGDGWIIANNIVSRSGKDSIKIMHVTTGGIVHITLSSSEGFVVGDSVAGMVSSATGIIESIDGNVITIKKTDKNGYESFKFGEAITNGSGIKSVISDIDVENCSVANVIAGNVIVDSGGNAIVANGGASTIISGNSIIRTGVNRSGYGIDKMFISASGISVTDNACGVYIHGNSISDAFANGINIRNSKSIVLSSNLIRNSGDRGITFSDCVCCDVRGNTIRNPSVGRQAFTNIDYSGVTHEFPGYSSGSGCGVRVDANTIGSNISITGNDISSPDGSGMSRSIQVVVGSGVEICEFVISGNKVRDFSLPAIYISDWNRNGFVVKDNDGDASLESTGTVSIDKGKTTGVIDYTRLFLIPANRFLLIPENRSAALAGAYVKTITQDDVVMFVVETEEPVADYAQWRWIIV